ncbi:hypothetical protein RHA1_ro06942 [Rhodococcus jostii RHA1]|uniref:Uncharacterized protein n=1 Tax=Rhodococcus jostii (strain RHA1) TaxID=101510 RepID=Q0S178_RHOJR|nr:hypothetical protein RHA1_ro06942 [Rhodococcus jostii RHA1]
MTEPDTSPCVANGSASVTGNTDSSTARLSQVCPQNIVRPRQRKPIPALRGRRKPCPFIAGVRRETSPAVLSSMLIAHALVSSTDQNPDHQLDAQHPPDPDDRGRRIATSRFRD